jgi:hypothetical protein
MSGDVSDPVQAGRLAGLFCRLASERFTGVVYAERGESSGVFSFRKGRVVFVEDPGDEQSLADMLLAKGFLTSAQYAEIATLVIESLAENEDVAFCELAVERGALSREQLDSELARIIRGRVIQAIDWEGCRIEIDTDPDSVAGILECPQEVYPLVHMGVRTFFDEERVQAALGPSGDRFVRLTRNDRELAAQFGLDEHEASLLARTRPDAPFDQAIEQSGMDTFEAWQLVCTLALASAAEIGGTAFAPAAERSGVRTTNAIAQPTSSKYASQSDAREERTRSPSQHRVPAVREEVVRQPSEHRMPAVREEVVRPPSERRMPAAREAVRPPSERRVPVARAEAVRPPPERRVPGVREEVVRPPSERRIPVAREAERPASQRRMPATSEPQVQPPRGAHASPAQQARGPTSRSTSGMQAAREEPVARAAIKPQAPATPAARPDSPPPDVAKPSQPRETADSPASLRDRRKPRKLSSALKRLDRELKQLRPQQTSAPVDSQSAAPGAGQAGAISQASYARARVDQLMRMRAATLNQQTQTAKPAPVVNGQEMFRGAQKELRDQQFARAHDLMRKACEAEPENQIYSMYCMYAAMRANTLKQEDINKLRLMLREKVSDDTYKPFAFYALGHVALAEKKDEAAEKFFLKAADLDKNNKDAERYVRILAVKRKSAAENEKSNKIFGIEIGPKKS